MRRDRLTASLAAGALLGGGFVMGATSAAAHPVGGSAAGSFRPASVTGTPAARAPKVERETAHADSSYTAGNPSSNTEPSNAFSNGCYAVPVVAANCDAPALASFDVARAKDGLGPMSLPSDFDSLPTATQLFVVANIDRVDHGLAPVSAMNDNLDSLSKGGGNYGVEGDSDPNFPNPYPGSDRGSGNWAGVGSALYAEFLWVYDDGIGSGNEDCSKSDTSGCWGHRENILWSYSPKLLMGAAEDNNSAAGGQSSAEEFIGGDSQSANSVTWSTFSKLFRVGLSATSLTVPAAGSASLEAWASGTAMNLSATTTGTGWSVSVPSTCKLAAGSTCKLTVSFSGAAGASSTGTLTVNGPNGARTVSLTASGASSPQPSTSPTPVGTVSPTPAPSGSPTPSTPSTSLATQLRSSGRTAVGSRVVRLTGEITTTTGAAVPNRLVDIQRRLAGSTVWQDLRTRQTAADGSLHVELAPPASAAYRLFVPPANGDNGATSGAVSIVVKPVVALHASHRRLRSGRAERLRVEVAPHNGGQRVALQIRTGRQWTTVATARTSHQGRCGFRLKLSGHGRSKMRARLAGTTNHRAALSHAVAITVH